MNNKTFLFLLMIIVLSISCLNMNDPRDQSSFINCRNSFDSTLVNHIPKKIPNNMVGEEYSTLENLLSNGDYAGIALTTRINNRRNYDEKKEQLLKFAKYFKNSQDSCLFVIRTYGQLINNYFDTSKCERLLPIPQYAICEISDSIVGWIRNNNKDIILLDYGQSDILNRPNLKKRIDLPKGYSNGFSKGITLDDSNQTIQYWLIIW